MSSMKKFNHNRVKVLDMVHAVYSQLGWLEKHSLELSHVYSEVDHDIFKTGQYWGLQDKFYKIIKDDEDKANGKE